MGTRAFAVLLLLALAAPPMAAAHDWRDDDLTMQQLEAFDRYLDDHPNVAGDLRRDPRLAINRGYLEDHPGLRSFLADHPNIRAEIEDDPYDVMSEVDHYRRHESRGRGYRIDETDLRAFDRFLADHPAVRHDLRGDPWLARSWRYLRNHDSFADFLDDHPDIRDELAENPRALLDAVERHDRPVHRPSGTKKKHR
jgi:hypothetical protein